MKRMRQKFFAGGGATATISGLILASAMIVGLMMSCKDDDSSKPTAPNIPVFPEGQSSENSSSMGFYSEQGNGEFGTNTDINGEFTVSVPAGEYLLTYGASNGGTYYVAFRATAAAVLHIGLRDNAEVVNVSVQKGKIINESQKTWVSDAVTLFAWPDGPNWNGVFQSDGSTEKVLMTNGWKIIGEIPYYDPGSEPNYTNDSKISLNPEPNNPLLATIETNNGWKVTFFGSKDQEGAATSLNFACYKTPTGDTVTTKFDAQSRLIESSKGDGKIVTFNWETKTISVVNGTLSCPQAVNMMGYNLDQQSLFSQAKAENPECLHNIKQCQAYATKAGYAFSILTAAISGYFTGGLGWSLGWAASGIVLGQVLNSMCSTIEDACHKSCEDMRAMFVASPNGGKVPLTINLDAGYSTPGLHGKIISYTWDSSLYGILGSSVEANRTVGYSETVRSDDEITLTIVDDKGCTDSYSQVIKLEPKDEEQVACNNQVASGGDAGGTYWVELGKKSGAFQLEYRTFTKADQIDIYCGEMYPEGGPFYSTGCTTTPGNSFDNGTPVFSSVPYSCDSSKIVVNIVPNCAGSSGTGWDFTVHCPQ